jgi:Phage integrase family
MLKLNTRIGGSDSTPTTAFAGPRRCRFRTKGVTTPALAPVHAQTRMQVRPVDDVRLAYRQKQAASAFSSGRIAAGLPTCPQPRPDPLTNDPWQPHAASRKALQIATIQQRDDPLQSRQAVAAPRLVGSIPTPLRGWKWDFSAFAPRSRLFDERHRSYTTHVCLSTPKSGKVRAVPMVPDVASALARLGQRTLFTGEDDLIFCGATGDFADASALRDRYKAAQKAAGLRPLRFHDLRHTFGTLAVRKAELTAVQAWMGHSHIGTTMRYTHHRDRGHEAQRLAEAFQVRPPALSAVSP